MKHVYPRTFKKKTGMYMYIFENLSSALHLSINLGLHNYIRIHLYSAHMFLNYLALWNLKNGLKKKLLKEL
jgi:hypothetical protein